MKKLLAAIVAVSAVLILSGEPETNVASMVRSCVALAMVTFSIVMVIKKRETINR